MITALLVGAFGVAGALLRFAVDSWFANSFPARHSHWPWTTLAVNVTGSFIIGAAIGGTAHWGLGPEWQSGLATGLAGGLTTFSSWTTATVRLASESRYRAATLNVAANLILGLAAAALGLSLTAL
ncbi:CrcB family protein [Arthrobacter sp. AL08]|uniref:fluoride efflux transporter FluC n=1 Tax=Micrococcaceae TaxID=1268 RepID=UPI001CFF8B7A|nr:MULTISPECIES: CrcB family protein [Micrococcaceae]MCB5281747.1 putative fluoride ion transporter CrcB [Arthrobacter sp. ES1]MDI3242653.1 CrcB family protein [Arthrobacter sp. AL05]MDI3278616.1 CrcB family protein [Arthrobacter sp. AL08]MDJ0351193.1 CrcB family protein [Pseudarthrobacter sp. PH31-O2]WGZ78408.1 CrcB family protein [Arthrobacter sp. EM1]